MKKIKKNELFVKIAVSGKGGVGKTTLTALLCYSFQMANYRVLAIDADPDANLAATLGFPNPEKIVPIVELKEHLLSLILDATASSMIETAITHAGVRVITGETIRQIVGHPSHPSELSEVILTNNQRLPCEALVIAIGVTPRTALVENTPVLKNRGIIVDKHMQTNISTVYACGDVAETFDFITATNRLLPLWPLAYQQGRIAGYNGDQRGA